MCKLTVIELWEDQTTEATDCQKQGDMEGLRGECLSLGILLLYILYITYVAT